MIFENIIGTGKIAVLAGAGISLDPPSNLLDGWSFMFETLRRVCPPSVDEMLRMSSFELRQSDEWKKSWVLSILRPPDGPFHRPGEQLRFENLMAGLVQSGIDPRLSILDCLDACDKPNQNHYALARMILQGHVIMTTNFDRLIEEAYSRLVGTEGLPLRVACMDGDFPREGPGSNTRPTLWKIHGSLRANGEDMRSSIQATMMSVLAQELSQAKNAFLRKVLHDFDLLLLGYSGSDDLDIVPYLANSPSDRHLIWIDHKQIEEPVIHNATQLAESLHQKWESDFVGRMRIIFTEDDDGRRIRDPEKTLIVTAPTSVVVRELTERYLEGASIDLTGDEFAFGDRFPDQVQSYFDYWHASLPLDRSAPYEFLRELFENRFRSRPEFRPYANNIKAKIRRLQGSKKPLPGNVWPI